MAKKQKFYVVWVGKKPGIYRTWEECREQVENHKGAIYKAFETLAQAEKAFANPPEKYIIAKSVKSKQEFTDDYIKQALAVDASAQGNPGIMEYRGVYVKTGKELFRVGKFYDATNNIGEFLAIVHGLAYLKEKKLDWPLYSDSKTAIQWVKNKKCKTTLKHTQRNRRVFDLIQRAEKWLRENEYSNPILKWDTKKWGEIPADFGRK